MERARPTFCSTRRIVVFSSRLIGWMMRKSSRSTGGARGGFTEEREPGPRNPPAAAGEHLLLAAEEGARGLLPPLSEDGEVAEDALDIEPDGGASGGRGAAAAGFPA